MKMIIGMLYRFSLDLQKYMRLLKQYHVANENWQLEHTGNKHEWDIFIHNWRLTAIFNQYFSKNIQHCVIWNHKNKLIQWYYTENWTINHSYLKNRWHISFLLKEVCKPKLVQIMWMSSDDVSFEKHFKTVVLAF
jgi:hypothetical protein